MTLLHADFLYYGAALFILALILVIRDRKIRVQMLHAILGKRADEPSFVHLSNGRRVLRFLLLFAALLLAVLAAARPAWGTETINIAGRGRDVLVLFDVSKSMLASDVAPSRLEHARYFLAQLVKGAKDDRFALISFAGSAFLECPFTMDKVSFLQYVEELSPDSIPVGGTDLERALQTAADAFRSAETPNKAIVLLTDGEELAGSAERTFAALKKLNVPLFVVGIGDPSVPSLVPLPDQQYLRDRKGELVRTKLNESLLRRIAETSGGLYFNSTAADSRLSAVAKAIDSREKGLWDKGGSARMIEHPEWFLGLAALLLLLALLLPERACAKAVVLLLLGLNGTVLCSAEPEKAKKTDPVLLYNAAREKQLASDPAFAAGYETVLKESQDPDLAARALHNLGAARQQEAEAALQKARAEVQKQQLDPALKTLDQALSCCDGAKELYRQALTRKNGIPARTAGGNLQLLANDRAAIEELKKKIEELKKQQQKAQQQTQKAKDENQQKQKPQSQKNDPEKDRKQNKEQNKDQKMDREPKSGSGGQSGKNELEKAQQEVKDLQKKADDLQQKQQSEMARQAQSELEKARQSQQKKDRKGAEKHLEEALKKLGASPEQKPDQNQGQQKPDQKDGKEKQQSAPQNGQRQPQGTAEAPDPQKKSEKENAAKMVELLTGDEKELRDALKAQMLREPRAREVEKDW